MMKRLYVSLKDKETLRYGENPQQSAYFVRTSNAKHTIAGAKQLHGKQLSYNNIKDADATLALVKSLIHLLQLRLNT